MIFKIYDIWYDILKKAYWPIGRTTQPLKLPIRLILINNIDNNNKLHQYMTYIILPKIWEIWMRKKQALFITSFFAKQWLTALILSLKFRLAGSVNIEIQLKIITNIILSPNIIWFTRYLEICNSNNLIDII